ncbi:MAG: T9SS type A sorting domain-containing protein [Saprospiraceae bacterium]
MKKKVQAFYLFLLLTLPVIGQELHEKVNFQNVIATAGTQSSASGTQLSWTLGELAVSSGSAGKRMITEGFHQPILISKPVQSKTKPDILIKIRPNPVTDVLRILVPSGLSGNLKLSLLDIQGRLLIQDRMETESETKDLILSDLAAGIYILLVNNPMEQVSKTFKIIKSQ